MESRFLSSQGGLYATYHLITINSQGPEVERWQQFLVGSGHLKSVADGIFGPMTLKASVAFQKEHRLVTDDIVGPQTYAVALTLGLDPGLSDPVAPDDDTILPGKPPFKAITSSQKERLFGKIEFEPSPTGSNPEAIRITNGWDKDNIVTVTIPQLRGVPVFGKPSSGRMRFNKKATEQLKAMWAAWEAAGLLDRILTYKGSYVPRFIRGSRTILSNHAYGTAFDINYQWNRLGRIPAPIGARGSVRELVGIANDHGFFWGGHFRSRPDGMHFEVAKII